MARIRYIHPDFFTDDKLADAPPLHRIFFAGLWGLADKAGRLEDRPKQIKVKILPYDDGDGDKILDDLHQRGFVIRYEANGCKYIQIRGFAKYQRPHNTEKESTIPPPNQCDNVHLTVKPALDNGKCRDIMGMGMVNGDGDGKPPYPLLKKGEGLAINRFEIFWKAYPKKIGKGAAEKSFKKINPSETLLQTMLAAIISASESEQWKKEDGQFIPNPATWLNQKRWEDEPAAKNAGSDFSRRVDKSISSASKIYREAQNVKR